MLPSAPFSSVRCAAEPTGGDILQAQGGADLNLATLASPVSQVSKLDLATDAAANTLKLDLKDLLDMSPMNSIHSGTADLTGGSYHFGTTESRHQMIVSGDNNDTITTTGGFTDTHQTAIISGHTYEVYKQGSYAQLLIETAMSRVGVQ